RRLRWWWPARSVLSRHAQELLGADAPRRAGGAGAHAGRAAAQALAHVALGRLLRRVAVVVMAVLRGARLLAAEQHPAPQAGPRLAFHAHLDHAVGAVALAVAAADAGVADVDLAVGRALDRIGRAVLHAVRVLAVAAGGRHVQVLEGRPRRAVQARQPAVGVGAGLLALVAAHAQRLVDQQHVGGLAHPLRHQEADHAAALGLLQRLHVAHQAALEGVLDPRPHLRVLLDQLLEG